MKHGVNGRRLFLFTGLIAVAAAYFYLKNTEDEKNYISRAAVARMTSLLDHTQEECEACAEALPEDVRDFDWYAPYVKIALEEGFFSLENERFYPMKSVTCSEAAYIAAKLKIDYKALDIDIYGKDAEAPIEREQWMRIYKAACEKSGLEIKRLSVTATSADSADLKPWHCRTDAGDFYFAGFALDRLKGQEVEAAVCNDTVAAVFWTIDEALRVDETTKQSEAAEKIEAAEKKEASEKEETSEKEEISDLNIKVVLNRDDFSGLIHSGVLLSSAAPMTLTYIDGVSKEESVQNYEAAEVISMTPKDACFADGGEVVIESAGNRIELLSLNRSHGHPSYRGRIRLAAKEGGLTIVNELSLEEYLYGVLPSEMPISSGLEALKVQAVCARSFAYKAITGKTTYSHYGADVDDSTSSQMYNNAKEDETACAAVDETRGELLYSGEEPIKAYFFSTSCGVTSDVSDVWLSSEEIPYLSARLQDAVMKENGGAAAVAVPNEAVPDLSDEAAFRSFIDAADARDYYEKDMSLFRWHVHLEAEDIKTEVETPTELTVDYRGRSGVVCELTVKGKNGESCTLSGEYNIRKALSVAGRTIECADGTKVTNQIMLPSGYFYINPADGGFDIYGGGFGHGVGMSQNGVAKMTERGMDYETILAHYFKGTSVKKAY